MHPVFILGSRPMGENDHLLEVFSRHHGRLALIVNSHRYGHLQPFGCYRLEWQQDRDWPRVRALQPPSGPTDNSNNGLGRLCGLYLNELLALLLPRHQPEESLFDLYQSCLTALLNDQPPDPWLRAFEVHLLSCLGYAIEWQCCANGQPVEAGHRYDYQPGSGLLPNRSGRLSGAALLELAGGRPGSADSWRVARYCLQQAIEYILPRPLVSRQILNYRSET